LLIYKENLNLIINLAHVEHLKVKDKYLHIYNAAKQTLHMIEYSNTEQANSALSKIFQAKKVGKKVVEI